MKPNNNAEFTAFRLDQALKQINKAIEAPEADALTQAQKDQLSLIRGGLKSMAGQLRTKAKAL